METSFRVRSSNQLWGNLKSNSFLGCDETKEMYIGIKLDNKIFYGIILNQHLVVISLFDDHRLKSEMGILCKEPKHIYMTSILKQKRVLYYLTSRPCKLQHSLVWDI